MFVSRRVCSWTAICLITIAVGLAGVSVADHTGEGSHQDYKYCVLGTGDNVGWGWELTGMGGTPTLSIGPAVAGATTTGGLITNFVDSINAANGAGNFPNAQQVSSEGCGPDPSGAFSVTILDSSLPFEFYVTVGTAPDPSATGCQVNGNPAGCPFNPTIIQAGFVGGGSGPALGGWGFAILAALFVSSTYFVIGRLRRQP